jgi:hypothetical protein
MVAHLRGTLLVVGIGIDRQNSQELDYDEKQNGTKPQWIIRDSLRPSEYALLF